MSNKFTESSTLYAKSKLRDLRRISGHSMSDVAHAVGITIKQLEDIHTPRDYGCHLHWDTMVKLAQFYGVSLDHFVEPARKAEAA